MYTDEKLKEILDTTLKAIDKKNPTLLFAKARLKFLYNSEQKKHQEMLVEMYEKNTLMEHLLDMEEVAMDYMDRIEPDMKKSFGLTIELKKKDFEEYVGLLTNLYDTLREMALKECIYC